MKNRDTVKKVTNVWKKAFPKTTTALIDERDLVLIESLKNCARNGSKIIVGVVGIGHLHGIETQWDNVKYPPAKLLNESTI